MLPHHTTRSNKVFPVHHSSEFIKFFALENSHSLKILRLQPVPGLPESESTVLTSNMDVVRTWCTMQWCCDARFALDVISYPVVVTLELINQRTLSWVRSRCSCWMWGCHVNKVTLRQSIYVNKIHHMITHSLPTQIIFMTLWQGHHSN